jgi:hypothetical protein
MNLIANSRTKLMFIILGFNFLLGSASIANAACNQPPIPSPGQTVTWLAANSPFQICADLTIPKRGTVIVQPGVQLQFQGAGLTVSGALKAQGLSANHISIVAQDVFPPAITVDGGNLVMSFTDVGG